MNCGWKETTRVLSNRSTRKKKLVHSIKLPFVLELELITNSLIIFVSCNMLDIPNEKEVDRFLH